MSRPRAGDRINNYLLDERVGAGTFGEVWRAHHHVFPETVAIKIPTDPEYVRNLRREGVAIHGLRHPNIVRAIDMDPYADPPYLVMEYVDGPSLRRILDRHGEGLPIDVSLKVLRGLLLALEAAHRAGVIHRDIKPANILVENGNDLAGVEPEHVRVTDFGLGRVGGLASISMLQSGSLRPDDGRSISGTIAYMSPEQRDGQSIDTRSDLYSCGVVLYEMLCCERPQGADVPSRVRHEVPAWLDEVFSRCYTRRDRRFGSASEVLEALDRGWAGSGQGRSGGRARAARWLGRQGSRCNRCGGRVALDDNFCIHCGHQLIDVTPRCGSCHAYMHAHDHYCIFCGTDLRAVVA